MVGTGFLTRTILLRPPSPYIAYPRPPLFQIFSNPFLSPLPLSCTPLLFLLSFFFGWMGDHATFDAPLNDIMDLCLSNFDTLVPEGPCCVFYVTRRQVYWDQTHVVFCRYSDLISHTHAHTCARTHTHTHTHTHTEREREREREREKHSTLRG